MSNSLLFLSAEDVARALTMEAAIPAVREAYLELSRGTADVPVRTSLPLPNDGAALFMPVHLSRQSQLGLKAVTVVPGNPSRGLPTIQALMTVFDADTGRPEAVMDGEVLTAIRTGAGSAVATDALARPDAAVAAIIGAGGQARRQLEGVCCVRPIREALIFDANGDVALEFAAEMGESLGIPVRVLHRVSGVREADIVCTATSSNFPVLADEDIAPGAHINAIGAYRPTMREIPGKTVARAHLVVDSREACLAEAGDLVLAVREGLVAEDFVPAEIGEVVAGTAAGRTDETELTIFKSVGNAVQDMAVAGVVLEEARKLGLGMEVAL